MSMGLVLNKSPSGPRPKGICDSGVDIFRKVKFQESANNRGQDQSQAREQNLTGLCLS